MSTAKGSNGTSSESSGTSLSCAFKPVTRQVVEGSGKCDEILKSVIEYLTEGTSACQRGVNGSWYEGSRIYAFGWKPLG